jgi:hypothetical protein
VRHRRPNHETTILLSLVPVSSAYSGDRVPTVFLTHFYVVLDQASFDTLRTSPQIAALAGVDNLHTFVLK